MSLQGVRTVVAALSIVLLGLLFYADVMGPAQLLPVKDFRALTKAQQAAVLKDLRECQEARERTDEEIDALNDTVTLLFNEVRYVRQSSELVTFVAELREWFYGALMIAITFLGWFRPRVPS